MGSLVNDKGAFWLDNYCLRNSLGQKFLVNVFAKIISACKEVSRKKLQTEGPIFSVHINIVSAILTSIFGPEINEFPKNLDVSRTL